MRDTEREAKGEAGSMQGAHGRTGSRDSKIRPWAKGGAKPLSHPGCPPISFLRVMLVCKDPSTSMYVKSTETLRSKTSIVESLKTFGARRA